MCIRDRIYLVIYGVYIALRPPGRAIHSFFNLLLPFAFPVQHFAAEIMPIGELDIAAGINGQLSGHLRHAEGQVARCV